MSGWRRATWIVTLLAMCPMAAGAQRYVHHPDPTNPDGYDRFRAKVDAGAAAAVIGAGTLVEAAGHHNDPGQGAPGEAFSRKRYRQALAARRTGEPIAQTVRAAPKARAIAGDPADLASVGYPSVGERGTRPRLLPGIPAVVGRR